MIKFFLLFITSTILGQDLVIQLDSVDLENKYIYYKIQNNSSNNIGFLNSSEDLDLETLGIFEQKIIYSEGNLVGLNFMVVDSSENVFSKTTYHLTSFDSKYFKKAIKSNNKIIKKYRRKHEYVNQNCSDKEILFLVKSDYSLSPPNATSSYKLPIEVDFVKIDDLNNDDALFYMLKLIPLPSSGYYANSQCLKDFFKNYGNYKNLSEEVFSNKIPFDYSYQ